MTSILVTGGYGFIGSEVVNVIFSEMHDLKKLIVVDRIDYCSREMNVKDKVRSDPRYLFVKGDIKNLELMKSLLEDHHIDIIIHMAAQSHVDLSFDNSICFTQDNILGTHTLLEASRSYGKLKRFVHMSTDEVYGEASHDEEIPHNEISLLNPTNPYAATKAAAEFMVKSYGYSYKLPYVIIRGNNVYGPGQFPDKLIPKFSLYLHLGKKVTIHGDGSSKRTFIHVNDMARGILAVMLKGLNGEVYNIGSRNEYSVMEITKLLCNIMKKDFHESITYVRDRNFNDQRYFICNSKISELGWHEEINFEQGILDTVNWYIKHAHEWY